MKTNEKNYPTHNLNLVIIVFASKIWRHYFYEEQCEVFTNHKSFQYGKAKHQRPVRLLKSLEIPIWKWRHITIDFVTVLQRTRIGKDIIWVVVA